MELILWRHAEAEDGVPDITRKLTEKGLTQAKMMASWLKPKLPKNCRILVSPATRTKQTADALNLSYQYEDKLSPGASAQEILSLLNLPNTEETILIIGHQPTLGTLAALLMTGSTQSWSIKKGAVWWLTSRYRNNELQTVLKFSMPTDCL